MNNRAKVIKEIKYGYDNVINIGEIVYIIHIENEDIVLIETKNNKRIRVNKDKLKII